MNRFVGGPADGALLTFARQPTFLRVVVNAAGAVDVLDLLDDEPAADERVYVYRGVALGPRMHINTGNRRTSGWRQRAEYRFVEDAPTGDALRDTESWRQWVRGQFPDEQLDQRGRPIEGTP